MSKERKIDDKEKNKLSASEKMYEKVFEIIPYGLQLFDKNGFSSKVNKKQKELLGLPDQEEGIGEFNVLTDPYAKASGASDLFKAAYRGKPHVHEFEYDLGIQENKWNTHHHKSIFQENIIPICNTSEEVENVLAVLHDVTSERLKENQLKESEERFKNLFHYSLAVMYVFDPDTHLLIEANKAAEKFYGWSREEMLQKHIEDINVMPLHKLKDAVGKVMEKRQMNFQFKHRLSDQTIRDVEVYSNVIYFNGKKHIYAIVHDISDRIKIQDELIASKKEAEDNEQRYRLLSGLTSEGILIHENGKIVDMNHSFAKMLGYAYEELIGKELQDVFIHPDDKETVRQHIEKAIPDLYEIRIIRKDGTFLPVEIQVNNLMYHGKKRRVAAFRDITERLNKEKELRESEEKFRYVFKSANVAKSITSLDGKLDPNKAYCDMLGYTPEELKGKNWEAVTHKDDIKQTRDLIDDLLRGEKDTSRFIKRYIHKNGNNIWADISVVLKHDPCGEPEYFFTTAIDISERIKNMQALKESKDMYHTFINATDDLVYLKDADLRYIFINEKGCSFYGRDIQDIIGKDDFDILPEKMARTCRTSDREAARSNKVIVSDEIIDSRVYETRKFPVTLGDGSTGVGSFIRDVTEQRNAQENIRRAYENWDRTFNAITDSIFILDKDNQIIQSNSTFSELIGKKSEDLRCFSCFEIVHNSKSHVKDCPFVRMKKSHKREKSEMEINGVYYEIIVDPILNERGEITGAVHIMSDISARKSAERKISQTNKELKLAKEKAEESDRLKSVFLANMSHEIRTPMNGILGFVELLQKPDISESQEKMYLDIVKKSSLRLLNTINDIIEISRIEAGQVPLQFIDINVNEMMNYFYRFFKPEAEQKGIELMMSNQPNPFPGLIRCDKIKLESILTNFIKNALKFTNSGSIVLGYKFYNGELTFFVEDSGIGIPRDRLIAIFERFVQADLAVSRPYEGSGLGLAICKAYADMLGARISVESEYGRGSTFYLTLSANSNLGETL